jgi:hypothetical protein
LNKLAREINYENDNKRKTLKIEEKERSRKNEIVKGKRFSSSGCLGK